MSLVNTFVPIDPIHVNQLLLNPTLNAPGATLNLYGNLSGEDIAFVVNLNGSSILRIFANGTIGTTYSEDLVAGGTDDSGVSAVGHWTPPTSGAATLTIAGIPLVGDFDTDADTTVGNVIALIAAQATLKQLVVGTLASHKLVITASALAGELGNQITIATTGTGASVDGPTLTGGSGDSSVVNAATGRVVFAVNQVLFCVLNSNVDAKSIVTPVVETVGLNLALGVLPLVGGFLLFNPVAGPQMTVSFSVLS